MNMSDVAVSNPSYASQAYNPSVSETQSTQASTAATGAYTDQSLQSSVDSALVEALLQMLVSLAQNQGLPKYKLNEIVDFLKDFLSSGGSVGSGTVDDSDLIGIQPTIIQPGISTPVVSQPVQQPIISERDFIDRFTTPLLMQDGTWTRATNSLADKAFSIPVGTPLAQVDLSKLQWQPGAQGTVTAPVNSTGRQDVAPTRSAEPAFASSEINTKMAEAGDLLNKINSGAASEFDVNDFLSKLQEIAKLFSEAVGNGAQDGARKTKKGAQAQVQGAGTTGNAKGSTGGNTGGTTAGVGSTSGGVDVAAGSVGADSKAVGFDTSTGSAPGFDGSTTGKSWLMAIAEAMGSVLGSKVQQMLTSSSKMSSLTINQRGISQAQTALNDKLEAEGKKITDYKAYTEWKDKEIQPQLDEIENQAKLNGQEFTEESSKLQGASQEFSMLQNAFSNCIKSIGEGLGQLARKG